MAMVEPLPYDREDDGHLTLRKDAPALARAVTIASGLGTTSAYTWLKMPCVRRARGGVRGHHAALRGARRGAQRRPGADLESWGRTLTQPAVRGWWSGAPCSTRPTATSGGGRRRRQGARRGEAGG